MKPPSSRDRISVDLRGMKATLMAQARERGLSPSAVVRSALAAQLGSPCADQPASSELRTPAQRVRLSMRMRREDADAARRAASEAGLALGDFVAVSLHRDPAAATNPDAALACLTASCAELATLSRNLHHLTDLLRHGSSRAALEYRQMLDTIDGDVRAHLDLATRVLAQLRPLIRRAS